MLKPHLRHFKNYFSFHGETTGDKVLNVSTILFFIIAYVFYVFMTMMTGLVTTILSYEMGNSELSVDTVDYIQGIFSFLIALIYTVYMSNILYEFHDYVKEQIVNFE